MKNRMEPVLCPGMCDQRRDLSIYEFDEPMLEHQLRHPERPMFKFLERLTRNTEETYWNSAQKQNFTMDARGRATQLPRPQINQDRPRRSSTHQPSQTTIARILCCLRRHGSQDSFRVDNERRRSPPEFSHIHEERIEQYSENLFRESDFSVNSPQQHCRNEHSKISFHREEVFERIPEEILESTDSESSSVQSSDTEFFDAREHFSSSESESNSPKNSRFSPRESILRRCRCITCTSAIRELGWPVSYRIAEVCDAADRRRTTVRMNSDVRVAKYDIRSGKVLEEWVEELDLSEQVIPIGYMRNVEMEEDIDMRRTRARSKLRSLFGADKRVRDEEFDDIHDDEMVDREGTDDFASFESLDDIDGLEPRTSKNPGMR